MRDWSLWDDEVAISVMDLCQTALGIHPNAFYSGVVFVKGSDGESRRRASTIAGEVAIALKEELHHLVSTEQYRIPGFTVQKLVGSDHDADKTKPAFNAELKATVLRRTSSVEGHVIAYDVGPSRPGRWCRRCSVLGHRAGYSQASSGTQPFPTGPPDTCGSR